MNTEFFGNFSGAGINIFGATHRFPTKTFSVVVVFILFLVIFRASLGGSDVSTFLGKLAP
ncbi:MAG: hypothetical protein ACI82Z_000242 [Cellvibrionaceae bacterium]|jgi:hypothetical protein